MNEPASSPQPPVDLRRAGLALVVASFVVLFQELALIRWLGAQVRVTAYFPNLVLISAFLGLGVGCLWAGRRSLLWLWPVSLTVLTGAAAVMSRIAFTARDASEHLWLLYADLGLDAPVYNGTQLPLVIVFCLSAASFVPLGQFVAERLLEFKQQGQTLTGYSCDLLGSLLGTIGFALASFAGTFPVVWLAIVFGLGAYPYLSAGLTSGPGGRSGRRGWLPALYLGAAALVLFTVFWIEKSSFYSPYYGIRTRPSQGLTMVLTNGSLHQIAVPLRQRDPLLNEFQRLTRQGYHQPYDLLQRPPGKVLVIGAGSGNDVAVALDRGATQVDAVEIDPVIVSLGYTQHPDRPYLDERVRVINRDARNYLNDCQERYDLVVFGTLDSMTRLSALSNVRLDNFVYTQECLRAAERVLTPRGGLALYFRVGTEYIDERLELLVAEAFGGPPARLEQDASLFNLILLAGPAFAHVPRPEGAAARLAEARQRVTLSSDDWPFLYLAQPGVSAYYLRLIAILGAISLVALLASSAALRRSLTSGGADLELLCYGVAFLLLETKLVTELNLIWGATWLTSAVVFASILLTVLLGTLAADFAARRGWRSLSPAGVGLLLALGVTYALPTEALVTRAPALRLLLSGLFAGLPIFFAAYCFALRFREREAVEVAFGWNLLGAVLGGFLEFSGMAVGLSNLTLLAGAAYLVAFTLAWRGSAGSQAAEG